MKGDRTMVIIVDLKKAYINPQTVEFDSGLKVNGETVKASLNLDEKKQVLNAIEYGTVAYINTEA